jgi:hypothetical protein
MCDPSNPSLKVVNTTEARVCGIPKTVKPPLTSTTPQTTPVVSSLAQQTATTAKPTATNITAQKQQQTASTKAISPSSGYLTWTTIASLINPHNTSSPSSAIAPQLKAVNQQQQLLPIIPIAAINSTAGANGTTAQNYTFAATSPIASSDKLMYLGYNGNTKSSHGNSDSKHDDSTDNKPHTRTKSVTDSRSEDKIPRIKFIATDNDSTAKKKTSSTKVDSTNDDPKPTKPRSTKTISDGSSTAKKKTSSTNDESSSKDKSDPNTESSSDHLADSGSNLKKRTKSGTTVSTNDDGNSKKDKGSRVNDDSESSLPDLGSTIRNKVDSIIRDSLGEVRHSLFGFSDNGGF